MFCPNCGEKLESQNQKFCASCGSVISNTLGAPKAPQSKVEENHVSPTVRSVPTYESKSIKVGGPGPHSKRCLAFSIVSLGLVGVAYILGGSNLFRYLTPYYYNPYYSFGVIGFTTPIIVHIAGLVFGILAKTNSSKAGKFEPINTLEKVGSVFGVFGIIINSIFIVVIPIILIIWIIPLLLMGPY